MLDSKHGDECSLSGSSFPSLKLMHSQEEDKIIDGATTISGEIDTIFTDTYNLIDACGMVRHAEIHYPSDSYDDEDGVGRPTDNSITEDGYTTLDGYPTDERTAQSFYQSKVKERVRLNILEIARNSLTTKKTTEILGDEQHFDDSYFLAENQTRKVPNGEKDVDDSSFLANVDVEDTEITQPPKDSDREQYVFGFSFLTTNNGEVVEEQPDDSSFIAGAGVEDVPGDFQSIGQSRDGTAVDSCYDINASTLSKASASTRISIGDMILKESNMAAHMVRNDGDVNRNLDANTVGEDQSASTYSYRRAYVDTVTLASNYTSTLSALTDDYLFHARRTGMSEPIKPNPIQEGTSFESGETSQDSQPSRGGEINRSHIIPVDADSGALISQSDNSIEGSLSRPPPLYPRRGGEIKRSRSVPVDADTGALISQSDNSLEESLARPPPLYLSDQATDFVTYENPDHLKMMLSYGEGAYADEEAARVFVSSDRPNGANGCCGWLTSSSRLVKMCAMLSILFLLTSVACLALALLLPEQFNFMNGGDEEIQENHVSSRHNDVANLASTNSSKSDAESEALLDDCVDGARCSVEGSRCTDRTTEICCGETFYSYVCDCANLDGKLQYNMCIFTNACLAPSCDSFEASMTANSTPTITSDLPSAIPSNEPNRSTQLPTYPTPSPSKASKKPTTSPTLIPTKAPTTTNDPTMEPTSFRPTSDAPIQNKPVGQVSLQAAKDTCVNEEYPDENYGTSEELRVDDMPKSWSIISFDGSSVISNIARIQTPGYPEIQNEPRNLQTFQVLQAKLHLYSLDQGGDVVVFSLPKAQHWTETSLTWNNKDQVDRSGKFQVGSLGWAEPFFWNEIDVTAAFANGIGIDSLLSFVIVSDSTNGVTFASRERDSGSFSPELVLTFVDGTGISTNLPPSNLSLPTFAPEAIFPSMTTFVPTYAPTLDST